MADVFPKVERVVYGKAPLAEVICQVRFPADLRVETEPPAEFQKRVRHRFPLLTKSSRAVLSALPAEVAKAFETLVLPPAASTIWQFNSEDGSHTLEFLKDNLTLVSRNYRRWEEFYDLFRDPLEALVQLYQPPFFTRVGLRYRDIIQRSKLGLGNAKWSALLAPHILAELAQPGIEDQTIEAFRNLLLGLPERGAKVRLQHGIAEVEGSNEQSYLIDCDFFADKTEVGHAAETLGYFRGNAARYFRWCITDVLHQAMDPQLQR